MLINFVSLFPFVSLSVFPRLILKTRASLCQVSVGRNQNSLDLSSYFPIKIKSRSLSISCPLLLSHPGPTDEPVFTYISLFWRMWCFHCGSHVPPSASGLSFPVIPSLCFRLYLSTNPSLQNTNI